MKTCFKCKQDKPFEDFYKHPQMKDGRVNKCKECNKGDVRENRAAKIEYYREYDRNRGNRTTKEKVREYREKNPNKYKAHRLVRRAIRSGKLFSEPCQVCGETNTVGHHDDYCKPLNIRWLCQVHHVQWHKENGPGLNG